MSILHFYHGSPNFFTEFDPNRAAEGHAQEGPGFYMTSLRSDAQHYAGLDGYIMEIELDTSSFIDEDTPIVEEEIETLLLKSSKLHEYLSDWGQELPEEIYEDDYTLPDSIEERKDFFGGAHLRVLDVMLRGETLKQVLENVWYDFYRHEPAEFLHNVAELGYAGHIVGKVDEVQHAVAFDPAAITVVGHEPAYATSLNGSHRQTSQPSPS